MLIITLVSAARSYDEASLTTPPNTTMATMGPMIRWLWGVGAVKIIEMEVEEDPRDHDMQTYLLY